MSTSQSHKQQRDEQNLAIKVAGGGGRVHIAGGGRVQVREGWVPGPESVTGGTNGASPNWER